MTKAKPQDPLRERGHKDPWEAGPWCARCKYYDKLSIGHSCAYFARTGQLRPEGEPTRRCSVRVIPEKPKPVGGVSRYGAELNGAAGPEWMTFRDVATVVCKATTTVCGWGRDVGLDRHIDGYHGVQVTVEEAVMLLKGHRFYIQRPEGMSAAQLELRKRLLEAGEVEICER